MNSLSVLILLCIRGNQITGSFRIFYQHNTGGKGYGILRRTGGFVLVYTDSGKSLPLLPMK